ncbi:sigma 54-interacting transcriptional regulator [Pyxidicoccus caerfyrddinensis]|uniref:sigma 54-interacting transcriptional regulator n=1 Tax=Pyxidicoccus caerfyrddinensis TaxID=2709663 RepID=UPI0013DC839B|nr:sigma 54-interacting transcriptional regulator [Pyxidicoccus caerfyrddinensis]
MEKDPSTLQPSGASGGASGSGEEKVPGLLRLFSGDAAMAEVLPLRDGALELGRGAAALGEVQDPRMSRRHARVHFDGRRFWVTDLGSQNGTFVEGKQVPAGAPHEAQRVLRMGDSLFVPCADVGPLARHGVVLQDGFVRGHAMQRLLAEVARLAQVGSTLHIHGESGAGKEGVARAFHQSGPRSAGPFVAVNCAAIPQSLAERLLFGARRGAYSGADADAQGYLQAADGGTLFLDEVVELDLSVQAKLLRVLESREVLSLGASKPKPVDLHVCSASNKDLRARVAGGHLREDLYFRLGRPEVMLPPLRQRPEEIPLLLQQEVRQVAPGLGLHVSLVEECLLRPWPGNVRELRVEVRSAVQAALLGGEPRVKALHLSPSAGTAFGPAMSTPVPMETGSVRREVPSRAPPLEAEEQARIEEALRQQGGNVAAAARALGMHRTQLRRLLARHGIVAAPGSEGD